jgi:outer membrane protein OmpA-like peptidoglycan-associated protein
MKLMQGAFVSSAVLLATAVSGFAQTGPNGPYVRLEGGLSHPGDISARVDGFPSASIDRKEGWIVGAAGGYQIGQFRIEGNVDYSQNGLKSITQGNVTNGLTGHTGNLSLMLNGLYDIPVGLPVVPYIGFGIGATDYKISQPGGSTDRWGFAVQPIVGVSYSITPQVSIAGEYRYFTGIDEVSFGGTKVTNHEHHFLLSATYHFGAPSAPVAARQAPPAAVAPQQQMFIVFFEFDKSALTADGRKVVDAAAAAFKAGKSNVALAGYTDLVGTRAYNLALSKRRAETVKAALVRDGVPASAIDMSWHGMDNPRVPTAKGVREPQNRRVEIKM